MSTLLARSADILVTMDDERRELPDAGLFVRDGIIEQVGLTEELPRNADVVLDMKGQILLPGFVNTHHHLDQTLTRALPAGQDINLFPWLRAHYPIWARRTPEASRLCTLAGLAALAAPRSGAPAPPGRRALVPSSAWPGSPPPAAPPSSTTRTSSRTNAGSTTRS